MFRGMKVTSGIVKLHKDKTDNRLGLTIDGGPPHCPCIYITQVLILFYYIFSNKYRFVYYINCCYYDYCKS